MEDKKRKTQSDLDWENRKLCSDPACIGVIGPGGRCKECGKSYEGDGDAFEESPFTEPDSDTVDYVEDDPEEHGEAETVETYEDEGEDNVSINDDDWENRRLCSDPACIGVIGPDDRCKECGKPYQGN